MMVHKCAFTDQGVPSGLPLWRPQAATAVLEGSIVILEGVTLVLIDKEVGGWGVGGAEAMLSSLTVGAL